MHSVIVEGLGKRYLIASKRPATDPPRGLNVGFARLRLPQFRLPGSGTEMRELWALRHVSFQVAAGTILGIVGANGAGKSTLLKIIARVTRPTEGRVVGRGRVVSLLELGAGFNPDFSARDNILMNAAMHGISRREVLGRMDDIVQFAEIEQFLDQPLRHYSSGMYLRLAFSVAINMRPDILLADEILAVGDVAFQERCLARVAEEGRRGLTVFFVSHDLSALARLCDRVLWLDKGELVREGDPETILASYEEAALRGTTSKGGSMGDVQLGRHANVVAEIASVRLLNAAGEPIGAAPTTEDVHIRIRVKARKPTAELRGIVDVHAKGVFLFRAVQPAPFVVDRRGVVDLLVRIPASFLAETTYTVTVIVMTFHVKESKVILPNALTFMAYGEEDPSLPKGPRSGVLAPRLEWQAHAHVSARKKPRKTVA
jgi:ABC-type polysaccharide/polyol phosphate transport system ATPase subunit